MGRGTGPRVTVNKWPSSKTPVAQGNAPWAGGSQALVLPLILHSCMLSGKTLILCPSGFCFVLFCFHWPKSERMSLMK